MKTLAMITTFIIALKAFAYEFKYLQRSPEALLMGDAYTTLADGAYTLFYNPALVARNELFQFYPMPVNIGATNFFSGDIEYDDLDTNEPEDLVNSVIGVPLHIHTGAVPTVKLGWFTFTPFAIAKTDAVILNPVHPILDIDYRLDRGFSAGIGYAGKGKNSVAVGLAVKYINRQSIFGQFDVFGKEFADIIASDTSDFNEVREALGYTQGKGVGYDFGLDWRYETGAGTFALGFSAMDIADTSFEVTEGTGTIPDQTMMIAAGTSYQFKSMLLDWTLSADFHPINANIDNIQKIHLGAKVAIPLLSVYAGWNGGHISYGAGFNMFPFEVKIGYYGKEVGDNVGDLKSERIVAYISLLDFTFDSP